MNQRQEAKLIGSDAVRAPQTLKLNNVQTVYCLAAAFSPNRDCSPGAYNIAILKTLCADLAELRAKQASVAVIVQGEIADAAEADGVDLASGTRRFETVGTRMLAATDIKDAGRIIDGIANPRNQAERCLSAKVKALVAQLYPEPANALPEARQYVGKLAAWLNYLIQDPLFFRDFAGVLALPPIVRPEHGPIGLEERLMPDPHDYPSGLPRNQALKIHREILQIIFPLALEKPKYITTQHVLDRMPLPPAPDLVCCYGFFAHVDRVVRQAAETFWSNGVTLEFSKFVPRPTAEFWDERTSQVWCRNVPNWVDYSNSVLHQG